MKKIMFYLAMVPFFAVLFLGCSKDDEAELVMDTTGDWDYIHDPTTVDSIGKVYFDFCLTDEQGNVKWKFAEGENIVFNFSIENKDVDVVAYGDGPELFNQLFTVYKRGNVYVGRAYDMAFIYQLSPIFEYGRIRKWRCPWRRSEKVPSQGFLYDFYHYTNREDLPSGDYTAKVIVLLSFRDDRGLLKIECTYDFKVE
jgi:hypothetical protein